MTCWAPESMISTPLALTLTPSNCPIVSGAPAAVRPRLFTPATLQWQKVRSLLLEVRHSPDAGREKSFGIRMNFVSFPALKLKGFSENYTFRLLSFFTEKLLQKDLPFWIPDFAHVSTTSNHSKTHKKTEMSCVSRAFKTFLLWYSAQSPQIPTDDNNNNVKWLTDICVIRRKKKKNAVISSLTIWHLLCEWVPTVAGQCRWD